MVKTGPIRARQRCLPGPMALVLIHRSSCIQGRKVIGDPSNLAGCSGDPLSQGLGPHKKTVPSLAEGTVDTLHPLAGARPDD